MVKKVELDTLDIEENAVPLGHKEEAEAEKKPPFKWPASRWIWLSFPVVVILLCAGTAVFYYRLPATKKTVATPPTEKTVKSASRSVEDNVAALNEFLITLCDNKDNKRVLVCDVAVELHPGHYSGFLTNVVRVRNIIYYKIAEQKTVGALMKPECKSILKNEIKVALVNFLGEGVVKTVYFTKFIIL